MLRVQLLGRTRLSIDDEPLSVAGRPKVVPLLAYMLLHRRAPMPRRAVAYALWPDDGEDEARANLRRHLNYLHALLPPAPDEQPWVLASAGQLHWNPRGALWLDVAEEWLEPQRTRLRERYLQALGALIARLSAARDYTPAIAAAQRLLAHDPWLEDVLRTLIRLRYEAGDRAGALVEYERFARTLRAELGTDPMAETRAAYEAIAHEAAPAHAPAPGPLLRGPGITICPASGPAGPLRSGQQRRCV